jgi:hypothetical protein
VLSGYLLIAVEEHYADRLTHNLAASLALDDRSPADIIAFT